MENRIGVEARILGEFQKCNMRVAYSIRRRAIEPSENVIFFKSRRIWALSRAPTFLVDDLRRSSFLGLAQIGWEPEL